MFIGGYEKHKIPRSEYVDLHRDLIKFLKDKHPEMVTKPGYDSI